MTPTLAAVTAWLDSYLKLREIPDYDGAVNGLQVENSGSVSRVVAAVDASLESITAAARTPGSLLVVHHGLFCSGMGTSRSRHAATAASRRRSLATWRCTPLTSRSMSTRRSGITTSSPASSGWR